MTDDDGDATRAVFQIQLGKHEVVAKMRSLYWSLIRYKQKSPTTYRQGIFVCEMSEDRSKQCSIKVTLNIYAHFRVKNSLLTINLIASWKIVYPPFNSEISTLADSLLTSDIFTSLPSTLWYRSLYPYHPVLEWL